MTRAKVKITPLGRRMQSCNRQRSNGPLNKKSCKDQRCWDHDAENCPPNLDFNVIEEIANGVEKMILSWSHLDEGEKTSAPEKDTLSMMWKLPEENKISIDSTRSRKKEPTEEFCVESETMSDLSLPKKIQTRPKKATETITAEFSVDENCPGDAINKNVTEAAEDSVKQTEETATYWYMEASSVPAEKNTEEATKNTDVDSKQSREACKDVSISGQSSNAHSSPRTPPISERSVKRMQSQEESSNKKLQLSVNKKTRRSEKATTVPISGASCSEEDFMKSPKSDCSLLDLTSNSSWNDPLVGSPIRKPSAAPMDGSHVEEFGPWDNVAGHAPVIVSRVTARPDSDSENCTKEKTSFVSFKLWKANKQSESELEASGEAGSHDEKLQQSVPERNPDDHEMQPAQTINSPQISDLLCNGDRTTGQMEELQIALLECATEYEIKTIEMKMKLKNIKNLKGEPLLSSDPQSTTFSEVSTDVTLSATNKPTSIVSTDLFPEDENQQVERVKRQVYKLQHQKGCLSKELADLKKKKRQFELQKKSLDAALHKLDRLEWEMVKKEQEVEDWQLRQRHAEAQLQDSVMELQRLNNLGDLADLPMDTASLLALLPTLRGFVQTLAQKDNGGGYYSDDQSQQDDTLCDTSYVDEIVGNLMHEIQGLQYELSGMMMSSACEEPKPKKIGQKQCTLASREHTKLVTRPSLRLSRDRYPYPRLNATS